MPFTPAHPAIILPFLRLRSLSATGLIVGSVSPDFEYFFKLSVSSVYSHTLPGLVYFDLPVTVLLAIVFHQVVKRNLTSNLPLFFQVRLQPLIKFDFLPYLRKHYGVFLLSALLGAASHLLWDSFTHNNTVIVENLSIYKRTYIPYDGVRYPLFYALQHISTAVGLTIVTLYVCLLRPDKTAATTTPSLVYWLLVAAIGCLVVLVRFGWQEDDQVGNWVVTTMSGVMMGSVCCGMINFTSPSVERRA